MRVLRLILRPVLTASRLRAREVLTESPPLRRLHKHTTQMKSVRSLQTIRMRAREVLTESRLRAREVLTASRLRAWEVQTVF